MSDKRKWDAGEQRQRDIERSIVKKFRKEIWCRFTKAINEYELIQDGDKIAVCVSGEKDSMLMAKLFQEILRHGQKNFEAVYLVMNPGHNEENHQLIQDNAELLGIPVTIIPSQTFDETLKEARGMGCNKIALGNHFDDVIETILMGMLYGAKIQTMMPKLHSKDVEGLELIRPLCLVREDDIIHWEKYNGLQFVHCDDSFTRSFGNSANTENKANRHEIKKLIHDLREKSPYIEKNIFRSVENVNLSTIVAYKKDGVKHHFLDAYETENQEKGGTR